MRRLLAEGRLDEPVPADVAARLDDALDGLVAERGEAAPHERAGGTVVSLLRHRGPQVLLAAAAVTVIGFGTTQLVGGGSDEQGGAGGGAVSTAESADDSARESAEDEAAGNGEDTGALGEMPSSSDGYGAGPRRATLDAGDLAELPKVRPSRIRADLTRIADGSVNARDQQERVTDFDRGPTLAELPCGPFYLVEDGRRTWVSYRDSLGLVLTYPAVNGIQRIELFDCDGSSPRRAVEAVTLAGR